MTTKRQPSPATPDLPRITPASLARARHQRICTICHHEDRYWVEQDFLHWVSPSEIARHYELPDRLTVYRHAHAMGLFALRKRKLRSALEFVIESADAVQPSAAGLVCAIRAYARITDDGEWIETPKRVIFSHETISVFPKRDKGNAPKRRLSVGAQHVVPADGPSHPPTDELALDDSQSAEPTEPSEDPLSAAAPNPPQAEKAGEPSANEPSAEPVPVSSLEPPASSCPERSRGSLDYPFVQQLTPLAHKIARMNAQVEAAMSRAEGGGDT